METTESIIEALPTHVIVSEYTVDRCYGGPEEGGWWYDWSDFVRVVGVFATREDAETFQATLREAQDAEDRESGHRSRYSVIGQPDTCYFIETVPGQWQDTERPHYC